MIDMYPGSGCVPCDRDAVRVNPTGMEDDSVLKFLLIIPDAAEKCRLSGEGRQELLKRSELDE